MRQMTIIEETIVDTVRKVSGSEDSVKNLKGQYKELFSQYGEQPTEKLAKQIVDTIIDIKEANEEIKSLRKDITANIHELVKPSEEK